MTTTNTTTTVELEARRLPAKVAACRLDALESQAVFKTVLAAITRPGSIERFPAPITQRIPSVLAPLLVLADVETRINVLDTTTFVWEDAVISASGARTSSITEADLIAVPLEARDQIASVFALASPGTAFSPESATRVAIGVHDVRPNGTGSLAGVQLVLRGPGIDGERAVCIDGLSEEDVESWKRTNSRFPAGIDVWFTTDDGRVLGIPRSTHVDIVATWPTQERN